MLSRLLITLVTCYLLLVTFATPAFAQEATPASSTSEKPKLTSEVSQTNTFQEPGLTWKVGEVVPPTSPIYTDLLVHNMFHTFSCLAVGQSIIGQPCLTYQITKNAQGAIQGIPVLSSANLAGGTLG